MKTFKIKTKAQEISFDLGLHLEKVQKEYDPMTIEGKRWFLAGLASCDYDDVEGVIDEQVDIIYDNHVFNEKEILLPVNNYIVVENVLYQIKDFDKDVFTVKEFSDMDGMSEDPIKLLQMLHKKCIGFKNIFRKLLLRNNKSWGDVNYYTAKSVIIRYLRWKQDLLNAYNLQAVDKRIPESHQNPVTLTPAEKFGIYHILMEIEGNDMQKVVWWMDKNIKMLFKYLTYRKVKGPGDNN
jgi:hypothetical protein